jgi:RNA polymerase sigma-70 factor (family 1)
MEKELLYRVSEGNQEAFKEIYEMYREPAIRFCNSIIKDIAESENLVQETFIKIWERREGIKPELNFTSYLFTIVRNRVFDYLKEVKKNDAMKENFWHNVLEHQQVDLEYKEEKLKKVKRAISGLTQKRKQILELNYEEGKSYEEIAVIMKISKNTVKNQLVKAKQIIRAQMRVASF